jgi:RHS repeat-associated protein
MTRFNKAADQILKVASIRVSYRQISALMVLLAVMLPITAPIPAWAYNLNLPPMAEEVLTPTASNPLVASSAMDFVENLFSGFDDKKKRKKNDTGKVVEKTPAEDQAPKITAKVEPIANNTKPDAESLKSEYAATEPKRSPLAVAPQANELPIGEQDALFTPENNLGTPLGQTEPSAMNRAAAGSMRERAGIANFSFDIPVAGLSGRGMNASAGITYNSRLWTKSGTNHFTYDVENSWLAAGFNLSLGYLELQYPSGQSPIPKILTDPNGTRHQLFPVGNGYYETADGTFIRVSGYTATYPDGTKIRYYTDFATGVMQRHYPTAITDRHGNVIYTVYDSDLSGRLKYIVDTLGRSIRFHYDTTPEKKLVAVTMPTYLASPNTPTSDPSLDQQTVRFYYETLNLQYQNRFVGTMTVPNNGSIRVLKYVYFPGTKTGYRYDYSSSYGMIYRITSLSGMQVDSMSLSQTGGVVTTSHVEAASTKYNYPGTDTEPPSPTLSDMPKYNKRIDSWKDANGLLSSAETFFNVVEDALTFKRTTTITTPDNTVSETIANFKPGLWDDGLIKETSIKNSGGQTMSKNVLTWEEGLTGVGGRRNPRVKQVDLTNEANQTKSTIFEYADLLGTPCQYNNVCQVKEYDFGSTPVTLLRNTVTTYETGMNYINNRLLHLVKSVKVLIGGQAVSRTEYSYDTQPLTTYPNNSITNFDAAYNPATGGTTLYCEPGCSGTRQDCCWVIPGYSPQTGNRGNVTEIKSWADATNDSDPLADTTVIKYDIAGNALEATANCCQLKKWVYNSTNQYAYPVQTKKGLNDELVTSAVYDFNTGLVTSSTDENNQATSYLYEPDTLRPKKTTFPNGGYTLTEYSDKLITVASDLVPGFVRQTTTLDATKTVQSYSYFDGRGAGIRSATQTPDGWSVSAMEYDNVGRAKKTYNPFYASTPTGAVPVGTKYTEVVNFDALGRATQVKLQDSTIVNSYPNEAAVTVTYPDSTQVIGTASRAKDQADKERRQIVDALGRVIRVDEPTASGLGTVTSPNQPTFYNYDGNDNLSRVSQSDGTTTQERKFKYDSLSRMTHEKQVEANATLDVNGVKGAIDPVNKWTKILKYDSFGRLNEETDARGVKTNYLVYDGLNRIKQITYSDGTPQVTYTYDQARSGFFNNGALTRVETAAGVAPARPDTPATATEYDYDSMGRVVKHRQSIGTDNYSLEYGYNLVGQLTTEKYPSGKIVTTNYDANGRFASMADESRTYLSAVQYQNKGNSISSITLGNGATENFTLNDRLQMNGQELKRGSEVLQKYDYGYGKLDASGNLDTTKNTGQLAMIDAYIGVNKQWTQKFSYDSIGRLSEAKEYKQGNTNQLTYKQKFDYDRFGNLYRKAANNPITGQANPLSYTSIEDSDISRATNRFASATTYDDAGQVVTDNKFRSMSFSYDADGRQFKATKTGAVDTYAVYNAIGNRVATKVNNVWKYVIYDVFGELVAEYGVPSEGLGGIKYVQQDWLGSVRTITNNNGFVLARTDYQSFGEEIGNGVGLRSIEQGYSLDKVTRQGFGLAENDAGTGQQHTWFRKLETWAGRWTSPDPSLESMSLSYPQSFNRYSYVENEPTNFIDPDGLLMSIPGFCSAEYSAEQCGISFGFGFSWGAWGGYGGGGIGIQPPATSNNSTFESGYAAGSDIKAFLLKHYELIVKCLVDLGGSIALAAISCADGGFSSPDCWKSILDNAEPLAKCLELNPAAVKLKLPTLLRLAARGMEIIADISPPIDGIVVVPGEGGGTLGTKIPDALGPPVKKPKGKIKTTRRTPRQFPGGGKKKPPPLIKDRND